MSSVEPTKDTKEYHHHPHPHVHHPSHHHSRDSNSNNNTSSSSSSSSCVSIAFRFAGGILILTCLLASLSNPYNHPSHPKATVNHKLGATTTATTTKIIGNNNKIRREEQKDQEVLLGKRNNFYYKDVVSPPSSVQDNNNDQNNNNNVNSPTFFDPIDLHLPQFPTLQRELDTSDIVVLYFGSSWCRQSKSVTAMMDQVLQPKLQKQHRLISTAAGGGRKQKQKKQLSIIYVSSDQTKNQYTSTNRNRYWVPVPFDNNNNTNGKGIRRGKGKGIERKRLKKYFKTCAKKEMETLGFQRRYDIPNLIVLSGKTHRVVSRRGVEELKTLGLAVVDYWTKLVRESNTNVAL